MRKLPIYPSDYKMPVEGVEPLEYNEDCTKCPLYYGVDTPCMPPSGEPGGLLIVIDSPSLEDDRTGRPVSRQLRGEIERHLADVKYSGPVAYDSALRCSPSVLPDKKGLTEAVGACTLYMRHSLDTMRPTRIIVCGQIAAWVVLGRTVDAYSARRGVAWLGNGTPVFWLPRPGQITNRFFRDRFFADLRWAATTDLATLQRPPRDTFCHVVESLDDALAAEEAVKTSGLFTLDVETCGVIFSDYWRVLCTATVPLGTDTAYVWPERVLDSPAVFAVYRRMFEDASLRKGGQNVKFDCKAISWRYKITVLGEIDDTLLIRRMLFSDARGDLATLAELVGMGGHKLEFQILLKQAKQLIRSTRSKIKAGKLTIDRIGANVEQKKGKKAAPPLDCPDAEVLRQACTRMTHDVDAFSYGLVAAMSPETLHRYCALDAIATARVYTQSYADLQAARHPKRKQADMAEHYERLVRHLTPTLTQIESWGMPVRLDRLDAADAFISGRLSAKLAELHTFKEGINFGSNKQLAAYLYDELRLPVLQPLKEHKGEGRSVEAGILKRLADKHPLVPVLLEWKQLATLKGTFIDKMRAHRSGAGRIHSTLNPGGTSTGRLSSQDPNCQQIPSGKKGLKEEGKMIKSIFAPLEDDWVVLQLDYSQVELRVAALMCGDKKMIDQFKSGGDFHMSTAKLVAPTVWGIKPEQVTSDHRSSAKEVVFGLLYGMTDSGLAQRLKCTLAEAARLRSAIFGGFPDLHQWYSECHAYAGKYGRCLTYWKGQPARRRPLLDIADPVSYTGGREYLSQAGSKARNAAVNSPVQGSASDFMLMSLVQITREILKNKWPARLIMSVHDSAIIECERSFALEMARHAKNVMESQGWGDVPIVVDVEMGPSWGELEKIEPELLV